VTVPVATAHPYDVVIGRGLTGTVVGAVGGARHAALLHPPTLAVRARALADALGAAGTAVAVIEVPDAEAAKTVDVLDRCWSEFAAAGLDRTSVVIGMGGGTVTDLAGFAAATYMRGVRLIQVPTTVLGMVDAAVGGKTGINTPAGKNMVGAFYEPELVAADLDSLATLPAADVTAGLAEIVKCGFIADPEILAIVEADPAAAAHPASPQLAELIRRGVAVKARVVAADLRESSLREILNYGHTLGHAIEKREDFGWRHGHAVAVGMVFAAELARAAGRLDDRTADRHRAVLGLLGLPTGYDADALDDLVDYMGHDKKTRDGHLRFVTLDGLAAPARLESPGPELLRRAYAAMNAAG
jgi:3-dehydroquinate synthase